MRLWRRRRLSNSLLRKIVWLSKRRGLGYWRVSQRLLNLLSLRDRIVMTGDVLLVPPVRPPSILKHIHILLLALALGFLCTRCWKCGDLYRGMCISAITEITSLRPLLDALWLWWLRPHGMWLRVLVYSWKGDPWGAGCLSQCIKSSLILFSVGGKPSLDGCRLRHAQGGLRL